MINLTSDRESDHIMATRTAPDSTMAVTSTLVTLHLIDASGDQYTDAILVTAAPSAADVEAWAAAYQAATQSSLWKITTESRWEGDADPDNADVGQRNSVKDGVNLLYKNITSLRTTTPRLVAPIPAVMQGNQDIPLLSAAEMVALIGAELAILTGFALTSAQFTERRERTNNPKIKA